MEMRQLRHFLTVVDCGSIGMAARHLGMSQPALTKHIRALERTLGAPLFTRSREGMALNQFGDALERRARCIVIEFERAEREIGELRGAERGRVVIATAPSFAGTVLLPRVLPAFRASHPRVEVMVIEGFIDRALPEIAAGKIDFACGTVPLDFVPDPLVCEVLIRRERILPIAGADNPITRRRHVTLQELQPGPWALVHHGDVRVRLNEIFLSRGLSAPEPAIVYDSVAFAKEVIRRDGFITVLSLAAVREEIAAGTLRTIRAPDIVLERNVGMFYRGDVALAPAAQLLLDRVRAAAAEDRRRLRRR